MSTAEELLRDFEDDDEEVQEGEGLEDGGNEDEEKEQQLQQQTAPGVTNEFDAAVSTGDELTRLHKVLRDHYSIRFPELETLVTSPIEYAKTVAVLKNGPLNDIKALSASADNMVGAPLNMILDRPTLMVVTVEGTTTRGREMTESELKVVLDTCERILKLDRERIALTESIQSRITQIAPNLAALIGSETAAQFLNQSGGLRELAKIPACNLAAQGSKRTEGLGFANIGIRSKGFLYNCPLIQDVPDDLKRQGIRIVSAKMVLATRADVSNYCPDGSLGEDLREQCFKRIEKLTEPPPNSGVKALPVPDDKPSRKRGGRRARTAKEAVAMTELRKAQNRVAFGKEESEVGYGTGEGTIGLGMLGQQDDGRIRATQIDQRTRAKLSKNNKGWGAATPASGTASSLRAFGSGGASGTASVLQAKGLRTSGIGTSLGGGSAGTASTIAFTPVQGLELVDPKVQAELSRKRKAEEDRWFKSGTFTQAGNPNANRTSQTTSDGFKVPALPPNKKVDTGEGKMGPPAPPSK